MLTRPPPDRTGAGLVGGLHRHPLISLTDLRGHGLKFFQCPADEHHVEPLPCQLGVRVGKQKKTGKA